MTFIRTQEKKTVLVDMDDILCECVKRALMIYNRDHGQNLTVADVDTWTHPPVHYGIGTKGFFETLDPIPGALEGVTRLHEEGLRVRIVSSPWDAASATHKFEWLFKHLPWIKMGHVCLMSDKHDLFGDFLIDDRESTVNTWSQVWPEGQALCIAYPHNRNVAPGVHRFEGYQDTETAWREMVAFILHRK